LNGSRVLTGVHRSTREPEHIDARVSAEHQIGFVRKLRQAGGQAKQFFVRAPDPLHHGVSRYASLAAAECIRGAAMTRYP
jgi:hypothetical protein